MSVSHLASSESHTGTTGSINEASFTWDHTPGGTARGVTVCVWTNANAGVSLATGVTYGGVAVPAVSGGEASRTTGEEGNVKVFHLGAGVPATSPAAVVVSRTNNAVTLWACCVTQAAYTDTEVHTPGMYITSSAGPVAERLVDDGSPGYASLRYAAGHFGYDTVPPPGANSTALQNIDVGVMTAGLVMETAAGQGSRLVGMENVASDESAIVHFAVREILGGVVHLASSESHTGTTGSTYEPSFTWEHTPGAPPRGVTVFVATMGNAGISLATGVTYEGVVVPAVPGGEASRTASGQGNMKVFHLGQSIPTASPATVVVSRTDNSVQAWAVCVTTLASDDTEVFTTSITLRTGAGGIIEVAIDDGTPGPNSLRYAGGFFGNDDVPTVGPNSVALESIDIGTLTGLVVRESTPGSGSRLVGMDDTTAVGKAVVHFAIRQIVSIGVDLFVMVYGFMFPESPIGELPTPGTPLNRTVDPEALSLSQVFSAWLWGPSYVLFIASPNHAQVTGYTAQLWTYGHVGGSPVDTLALGVPTPDAFNQIVVNLAALYAGQAAGEYTVSILTTTASGSANSEESDGFTLPLA